MAKPYRIDVPNHIIPAQYLAGLEKAGDRYLGWHSLIPNGLRRSHST